MDWVGDFETTTDENDCRVWGWGLCSIKSGAFIHGKTLTDFMCKIQYDDDIARLYFHNLKFDGEFIENWLFQNGYKWSADRKLYPGEFGTLISDMGTFYQIRINMGGKKIEIRDSLKIVPLPVSKIAKAFGLSYGKGEIDYGLDRPIGYEPTADEIDYINRDCSIVAAAIKSIQDSGLTKMTTASNAMTDYKKRIGKRAFEKWFPVLEADKWLRRSYKGGFVYANPKYQGKAIGEGSVYDVNSLYPYVLHHYPMPCGHPVWFEGEYQKDRIYQLYIVGITCQFILRKGFVPTIQLKNNPRFGATEYLVDSGDEEVFLCLTNIDLELFMRHYEVVDIQYHGGYKFMSNADMFKDYIDYWTAIKIAADKEGNDGQRTIAKLMLNSLYGKFGLNPRVVSKIPSWDDENQMVRYRDGCEEWRNPIYVPVASFTTAYARRETISAAQRNFDRFLYADTDSLHLVGVEEPNGIKVDDRALGAWKHEANFSQGKYLRAKSYAEMICWEKGEDVEPFLKITCAGMPERCKAGIGFDAFEKGLVVTGKLEHKRVSGGVVLREKEFTIKG